MIIAGTKIVWALIMFAKAWTAPLVIDYPSGEECLSAAKAIDQQAEMSKPTIYTTCVKAYRSVPE